MRHTKQPLEHLSMQAILHMMEKMERINVCTLQGLFQVVEGKISALQQASFSFLPWVEEQISFWSSSVLLILVLLGCLHFILSAQPHWGPEGQSNTIFSHQVTPRTAPRALQISGFSTSKYISLFCKMKSDLCVRPPVLKE